MFHQRDYILRMIEETGRFLCALRDRILKREALPDQTRETLRSLASQAGVDTDVALALEPESLHVLVSVGGDVDPGRSWLLGELLYLTGLQAANEGWLMEARIALVRARTLFEMLEPEWSPSAEFAPVGERLAEIERILAG